LLASGRWQSASQHIASDEMLSGCCWVPQLGSTGLFGYFFMASLRATGTETVSDLKLPPSSGTESCDTKIT